MTFVVDFAVGSGCDGECLLWNLADVALGDEIKGQILNAIERYAQQFVRPFKDEPGSSLAHSVLPSALADHTVRNVITECFLHQTKTTSLPQGMLQGGGREDFQVDGFSIDFWQAYFYAFLDFYNMNEFIYLALNMENHP